MTFDEILDEMNADQEQSEAIRFMERLRDTYAPTIEMTQNQYNWITDEYAQEDIVEAVARLSVDGILIKNFDASFWYPLTQREVVQAWLRPESIKVIDTGG